MRREFCDEQTSSRTATKIAWVVKSVKPSFATATASSNFDLTPFCQYPYHPCMLQTSISLPKAQEKRLKEAAIRFGFSSEGLLRRIVADATKMMLETPEKSLDEYEHPEEIVQAYKNALRDERNGKILRSPPKSLTRRH